MIQIGNTDGGCGPQESDQSTILGAYTYPGIEIYWWLNHSLDD